MEWFEGEPEKWEVGMIAVLNEQRYVKPEGWQQGDDLVKQWGKPWLELVGDNILVRSWHPTEIPPDRPGRLGGYSCEDEPYGILNATDWHGPVVVGWSPGFSADIGDLKGQATQA